MYPTTLKPPAEPLPSFATAEVLARELTTKHGIPMTVERLSELASIGCMPHYFIDGKGPYFRRAEAKEYLRSNLIERRDARPFPTELKVIDPASEDLLAGPIPEALVPMAEKLRELPISRATGWPCVYFLILGGQVVYVGQTINLPSRVTSHLKEKMFDRVLYLSVPESALLRVESAFIAALRPPLNGKCEGRPKLELDRFRELVSQHIKVPGSVEVIVTGGITP